MKFWSKINYLGKINIVVKNRNFSEKLKYLLRIEKYVQIRYWPTNYNCFRIYNVYIFWLKTIMIFTPNGVQLNNSLTTTTLQKKRIYSLTMFKLRSNKNKERHVKHSPKLN